MSQNPKSTPLPDEELTRLAASVIDTFEDYLSEKGIQIESEERDEYEAGGEEEGGAEEGEGGADDSEPAIIFGSEYYSMEDAVKAIIARGGSADETLGPFEEFLREHGHTLPDEDRPQLARRAAAVLA